MYRVQDKPDEQVTLRSGSKAVPLVTLKDEHGGVSHIIKDDGCFVLINGSADEPERGCAMVKHWYPEAADALGDLMSKMRAEPEGPYLVDGFEVDEALVRRVSFWSDPDGTCWIRVLAPAWAVTGKGDTWSQAVDVTLAAMGNPESYRAAIEGLISASSE